MGLLRSFWVHRWRWAFTLTVFLSVPAWGGFFPDKPNYPLYFVFLPLIVLGWIAGLFRLYLLILVTAGRAVLWGSWYCFGWPVPVRITSPQTLALARLRQQRLMRALGLQTAARLGSG